MLRSLQRAAYGEPMWVIHCRLLPIDETV